MKLWLAPLHGITYFYFRNLLCRHAGGIDAAITPFFPVLPASRLNVRKWKDLLPENNTESEVIPQLMGNVASDFVDTVLALEDLGYSHVNWNLGCSMKQIVRRKRGCGLMPYPSLIEETVRKVTKESRCKLSLKIRLGLHSPEEGKELLLRLNAYPVEFIVIHPRLGEWLYEGKPDLAAFDLFYSLSEHELVYNGDITDLSSFLSLSERYSGMKQWMLGRGLLRNPFLAEQIREYASGIPFTGNYKDRFRLFYRDLIAVMPAQRGISGTLGHLKELWHYFAYFWNLDLPAQTGLWRINDLDRFIDTTWRIINAD